MIEIIENDIINASAKILWLRIFNQYSYQPFYGTYSELARELKLNVYSLRKQIYDLKNANAIIIKKFYGDDKKNGNSGLAFQLNDPKDW